MSLEFTGGDIHADALDFGTALNNTNALDSDTLTIVVWVWPDSIGTNPRLLGNREGGTFSINSSILSTHRINLGRPRVTTQTLFTSNNDTLVDAQWNFIGYVDNGDGNDSICYWGDETTVVTDQTNTANTSSGAITTSDARNFVLMNR